MSHFLDRLTYFSSPRESFADGHGVTTGEDRTWEDAYRNRWAHDKIVRSTHGVNCTGSCSWKIYVKGGIVTWETQQTDYPRTRWDMPNHEPRGCSRGASYSWYLYSANRVKYPMVRGRLLKHWRKARLTARGGGRVGVHCRRRCEAARLPASAWLGRVRALQLGRSKRDRCRGERVHDQEIWSGPGDRFLAHPSHVDGQLRGGQPLPESHRRRLHELLRLVLRPAAEQSAGMGRADRRAGIGRLVQLELHHRVGFERAADAHAGRALLHRGALQGHQDGCHHTGLFGGRQARRYLDEPEAGHRRRRSDGDGSCDPQGVLFPRRRQGTQRLLR